MLNKFERATHTDHSVMFSEIDVACWILDYQMQLIDVKQLTFAVNQTQILSDVSLYINAGEFVGIIGPNGSGKTTLLNCLSGLITDISGAIELNNKPLSNYSGRDIARQMAYLHQESPDDLNLNVRQVVALGLIPNLSLFGVITEQQRQAVATAIAQVGLENKTELAFEQLSGGEKQRCLLAKVMVQKPQILLMDEPTNHLDIHYQVEILTLVKSLGITVIASFHDLNLAASFCERLICLNNGQIHTQGSVEDVLQHDILESVFKVPVCVDTHPLNKRQRISFDLRSELNGKS